MPGQSADLTRLKALLEGATAGLADVEQKRLFGCDAYFVNGNMFAMAWKEDRLALRLQDGPGREELLSKPGAEAWNKAWVLAPAAWHAQPGKMREWVRKAWELALARPNKARVTGKRSVKTVKPAIFRRIDKGSHES